MKCIGYFKGSDNAQTAALLKEYADKHGIALMLVAYDGEDSTSNFRMIQNRIKLGECDSLLVPSYNDLGSDKYMRLENELFLNRNGVRLIKVSKGGEDHRHSIVLAVKRYFSYITDWDSSYGVELPLFSTRDVFKRVPPIGYEVADGAVTTSEIEAETVREVFRRYAAGDALVDIAAYADAALPLREGKIGNMTVKTILRNERYLGRLSKKGYHLPPVVSFDLWCAAHERLERDYGYEPLAAPYYENIYSSRPITFISNKGTHCSIPDSGNRYRINTAAFDKALEETISLFASRENADKLYLDHVIAERASAEEAYPNAAIEHNRVLHDQQQMIEKLVKGDRSEGLQNDLDIITDRKNECAMRLRRIASEKQLYFVSQDEVRRFFIRAAGISGLSLEEKTFIANAFVWAVRITDEGAFAYIRDPSDGGVRKRRLRGVFVK